MKDDPKLSREKKEFSEEEIKLNKDLDQIPEDEKKLKPEQLQTDYSKNRTHMSEHRTHLSEYRTDLSDHRTELSELRSDLSIERTRLSYDNNMNSWIRTSVSLLTFGFSIYKFFEDINADLASKQVSTPVIGAKQLGIFLIAMSFINLLFATIQNHNSVKALQKLSPGHKFPRPVSTYVAYALMLLSFIILFTIFFKL